MSDLVIRKIPFNLKNALEATFTDINWLSNYTESFLSLSYSLVLENTEYLIQSVNKEATALLKDGPLRETLLDFSRQEINHAKYHQHLNNLIAKKPPVKYDYHPRVYSYFEKSYQNIRKPLMGRLLDPGSGVEKQAALKEALLRIAIFESLTCITGITFFNYYFDNNNLQDTLDRCRCLPALYLFGYHLAEELEHCSASIELYEKLYSEEVWAKKTIELLFSDSDSNPDNEIYTTIFSLCQENNVTLTQEDLENNAFIAQHSENRQEFIIPGFTPEDKEIKALRNKYVAQWDNEVSVLISDKIEKIMQEGGRPCLS